METLIVGESTRPEISPLPSLWGGTEPESYPRNELHKPVLKAFHRCLFGDRKIFVFPRLHDALWEDYKESPRLLPEELHRKALRQPLAEGEPESWKFWDWPEVFKMADPFSRSSSWRRASSLEPLLDINHLGYDIQVPVNPIAFKIRGQKTVLVCRNILAESDEGSIEEQLLALKPFRNEIVSILDTGSRGVHAVFRLPRWIKNPYLVDWKRAKQAQDEKDLRNPIPQFVDAAGVLKDRLQKEGFQPDTKAIVDHSRLTRLPGFRHGKTGRVAELVYLNPHASYENSTAKPVVSKRLETLWSSERASISSISVTDSSDKKKYVYEERIDKPQDAGYSLESQKEECGGCGGLVLANVYKNGSINTLETPCIANRPSNFLADWARYQDLKTMGIPERHTRIKLHMPMFTMATVFGWNDDRLAEEWRIIVDINPECIGCDTKEAVSDILAAWASRSSHEVIRMPDLTELPDLDERKSRILLEALKKERCPKPRIATRIVAETLIPMGRLLPAQSKGGTLGLKSKDMLVKFGSGYRIAREGLAVAGLLEVTNRSYKPGDWTMQYKVNWPRLLILCGYEAGELKWP